MIDFQSKISDFDSNVCGKIPVNLINVIQPYSILLVANLGDHKIIQISVNAADVLQREVLSCKLEEVFSVSFSEELEKVIKEERSWRALFNISLKGQDKAFFSILLHISEHFIFVELEKSTSQSAGK